MRSTNDAGAGWRPGRPADLDAIVGLAEAIHPSYPESPSVFANRLALHAAGVRLAMVGGRAVGYAIGHPWRGDPPLLDCCLDRLPDHPDRYWIHDLALLPDARGLGLGRSGARHLRDDALMLGLHRISLIAVGEAAQFWRRAGFVADPGLTVPGCYGTGAAMGAPARGMPAD